MASEAGTYLYAVATDLDKPAPTDLTGVSGGAVRVISHSGLVAYVSTVSLDEFGEEPLRTSMEDLDWLSRTARTHHQVVETVAVSAPTAPVRLITVYSGDEQVEDLLRRRREDFSEVLARIAGRWEWGVKVYAEAVGPPSSPETAPGGGEETNPGTAYLKRRQASLRDREKDRRHAVAAADEIHETLSAYAVAARRHRTQDPQLSGRQEWMVLNGAYLIDGDNGEEFTRILDGLRKPGIQAELTGPWVPYSFTVTADAAGGPDGSG
ncbi:GvpL/GvpF family gas vesicle protein [Sinosporangium siamense]|uniref:Gas vesicle protein n=1 Tax=Sinosporangium siamense TaxID=1367973 RepID=A0A919RIZ4_9ACTN|nr:GvpL/GvpF family gas vesicle protein [Sinosporangium siamense]GII92861.1 gas vesicle protein [Sinosporangium siamense]